MMDDRCKNRKGFYYRNIREGNEVKNDFEKVCWYKGVWVCVLFGLWGDIDDGCTLWGINLC